jgi:hypothetical protein
VLGTARTTTITSTQLVIGYEVASSSTAARVVSLKRSAPITSKTVGQILSNLSQGQGDDHQRNSGE